MADPIGFRVRLRVRLTKALHEIAVSRSFVLAGREAEIRSQKRDQPLSETAWVVIIVKGFPTEDEARYFGEHLRNAVEIAGLCSRLGVDVGRDPFGKDRVSHWINEQIVRASGQLQNHERLFPTVHGLAIVPDDDDNRFAFMGADLVVRASAEHLLGAIGELAETLPADFIAQGEGVRLLNMALINPEHLGQIVLAISAVEALGQKEKWTISQKAMIARLIALAREGADFGGADGAEIAERMGTALQKVGLGQGVVRVLNRLGLGHLLKEWKRVYNARSAIFHGLKTVNEPDLAKLAMDTLTLCGTIVLTDLEQGGVTLPSVTSMHFPKDDLRLIGAPADPPPDHQ